MIDKDKLMDVLDAIETDSEEFTPILNREQIDWICENQEKFTNVAPKPYEIRIDFAPIVLDLLSLITELRNRVTRLETSLALARGTAESSESGMDHSSSDCAGSLAQPPSGEASKE